jgi:hypothetical protein
MPELYRSEFERLRRCRPALSPRELAVRFTDNESYFVSQASVYRMLKAHELIAQPGLFIVIKAADEFKDKTTAPTQLRQTDFTPISR